MIRFSHIAALRRKLVSRGFGESIVFIVLLMLVLAAWVFIELSEEVLQGETHAFDRWIVRSMRTADDPTVAIGPTWLTEAARDITALGSPAVLVLATFAAAGYLLLVHRHHAMWIVLGAAISGQILTTSLKTTFARERPSVVPHLTEELSASFPSGHTMMSAVVYLTLAALLMRLALRKRVKTFIVSIAVAVTVVIGLTRMYLGVHYPTDVLAGWAGGLTWALLWWLIARYLQRRGTMEKSA